MCYIVFIPRIQRPLRPASVFSMMMMMMSNCQINRHPSVISEQNHSSRPEAHVSELSTCTATDRTES